jgi:Tfp pilus assembly protein PilX
MPPRSPRDEGGAVLILALVFVIIVTFSVFGLITFGGVGIKNTTGLSGQRSLEYAADGATTAAIAAVRYSPYSFNFAQLNSSQPTNCLPDGATFSSAINSPDAAAPMSINGVSMAVDCIAGPSAPWPVTRVVTFYSCLQGPCTASNAVVAATVDFEDVSSTGSSQCSISLNVFSTCGTGEVITNWLVRNADD